MGMGCIMSHMQWKIVYEQQWKIVYVLINFAIGYQFQKIY